MTPNQQSVLSESLALLKSFADQLTQPKAARLLLRPLQERHSWLQMDLIWEISPSDTEDDYIHYDLLLQLPGEATVTLSYCPFRNTPWVFQGASRWRDKDLVRVNSTTLGVDRALIALDFIWEDRQLITQVLNYAILVDQLDRRQIKVSLDEVTAASAADRLKNDREDIKRFNDWLASCGLTEDDWLRILTDRLKIRKLREEIISSKQVQSYFSSHCHQWLQLTILIVPFSDLQESLNAMQKILDGQSSLGHFAEQRAATPATNSSDVQTSFVTCNLNDLPSSLQSQINSQPPDRLLGPIREGNQFLLVKRLATRPVELDNALQEQIWNLLFDEWLEEKRRTSHIQWFWGPA